MKQNNDNKSAKKIRRTLVAFLLMLSFVLTAGTFAYWATEVEGTSQEAQGTLTVGSGDNVETVFKITNELNSGGYLVPAAQVENSREKTATAVIDLSYDVQWLENETQTQLEGTQTIGLIKISHEVVIEQDGEKLDKDEFLNIYNLISVEYDSNNVSSLVLDEAAKTFNFHITMSEPANQAEYNLISEANISITFTYSIDATDITVSDLKASESGLELSEYVVGYLYNPGFPDDIFPVTEVMLDEIGLSLEQFIKAINEGGEGCEGEISAYFVVKDSNNTLPIYEDGNYPFY